METSEVVTGSEVVDKEVEEDSLLVVLDIEVVDDDEEEFVGAGPIESPTLTVPTNALKL